MLSIQNPTAKAVRSLVASHFPVSAPLPPLVPKAAGRDLQSIIHQMTVLFSTIDDFLKGQATWTHWRRSPNNKPRFTDAEVLTVGLLQSCLKVATLKHAHRIVATDFLTAFPALPSYAQFMARLHLLQPIVGRLIQQILPDFDGDVYLMDDRKPRRFAESKPIPVCKPIRHGRVRLLREDGAYFGRNSCGWYFGFKLHVIAHRSGTIFCAFLTSANTPDRDAALALAQAADGGILLADKAYRGKELETLFDEQADLLLITPGNRGDANRALISGLRERIETTFSQLYERFIDRVYSRSFHGLWNTVKLKILHLNFCHAGLLSY